MSTVNEFELINRYFVRAGERVSAGESASAGAGASAGEGVILGIGDDAAVLRLPPGTDLVAAVDTLVEGRHFPKESDPHSIGYRSLAVNLSDLAAMGATPAWATLALTLPSANADWLDKFSRGLLDLARAEGVVLVGGDTTRGALTISVQIMGHVARGTALGRGGAVAGDLLVVTGTLGDAGAGLALLLGEASAKGSVAARALVRRFEYPSARVKLGRALRGIANAAMDLSDGLVGDLPKLAAASGLSAHVAVERLPVSPALCELYDGVHRRDLSLAAGDDYELLIAVPEARYAQLAAAAAECDVRVTIIGNLRPGSGVNWSLDGENWQPDVSGYDHFR